MMERVEAGEDPRGPQTMGSTGESSATTGDLSNNSASDWSELYRHRVQLQHRDRGRGYRGVAGAIACDTCNGPEAR